MNDMTVKAKITRNWQQWFATVEKANTIKITYKKNAYYLYEKPVLQAGDVKNYRSCMNRSDECKEGRRLYGERTGGGLKSYKRLVQLLEG